MATTGAAPPGSPSAAPTRTGPVAAVAGLLRLQVGVHALAANLLVPGDPGWLRPAIQLSWMAPLVVGVVGPRPDPRSRRYVAGMLALQLATAPYFVARLVGVFGEGWAAAAALVLAGVLLFAAAPAMALGLVRSRSSRRWFGLADGDASAPPGGSRPVAAASAGNVPRPPAVRHARALAVVLAVLALPGAAATAWITGFAELYSIEAVGLFRLGAVVAVMTLAAGTSLTIGVVLVDAGLDRWALVAGAALVIGISAWWLVQARTGVLAEGDAQLVVPVALLHAALATGVAGLALSPGTARFVDAQRAAGDPG